ncbi:hypothetical protein ACIP5Y_21600 [Nocardia sp. NPDC088792]|uniref:hypothetical protein n=1 Tax=Nocardia sp. NPDC088792 TaxID=3364332 RepID=UPI0038150261
MTPAEWSWVCAAVSVLGCWIGGRNPRWGWTYGILAQIVWVAYGLVTNQPGLIALSVVFAALYGWNLHRWDGTDFQAVRKHSIRR